MYERGPEQQQIEGSMEEFYTLRTEALSGQVSRTLEGAAGLEFCGRLDGAGGCAFDVAH